MTAPNYPIPGELDHPKFRRIFDYWHGRFRGDALPAKSDIDPTDIPDLLGHINIIEVVRTGIRLRFRYRLWGTMVSELYGRDFTGRFVEEIVIPTRVEKIQQAMTEVVESRTPHFWRVPLAVENRDFLSTRRLLLPLAADGRTVDFMLALMVGDRRANAVPDTGRKDGIDLFRRHGARDAYAGDEVRRRLVNE